MSAEVKSGASANKLSEAGERSDKAIDTSDGSSSSSSYPIIRTFKITIEATHNAIATTPTTAPVIVVMTDSLLSEIATLSIKLAFPRDAFRVLNHKVSEVVDVGSVVLCCCMVVDVATLFVITISLVIAALVVLTTFVLLVVGVVVELMLVVCLVVVFAE